MVACGHGGKQAGVDSGHPSSRILVCIPRKSVPPLRELGLISSRHVLQVSRHLQSQVVLGNELGVAVLQLNELLLKFGIAQQRVRVICGVVNNPESELRRSGSNAQPHDEQKCQGFSFHFLFSSLSFTDVAVCTRPSQVGRHLVIVVVGHREVARKIDLYAMAFPDRYGWQDVEKLVENLFGRLRHALSESLTHEVGTRSVKCASGSGLRYGPERTDGEGSTENAEIMVV